MGRFRRFSEIAPLRAYLEQQEFPRLQMFLFVSVTGLAGFLADWLMLHAGVHRMMWRYGLAVLLAYLPFLGMLRLWLHAQGVRVAPGSILLPDGEDAIEGIVDGADLGSDLVGSGARVAEEGVSLPSLSGGGDALDLGGDLDEMVVVVLVIAALVGLFMAVGYLVWQAPAIFAELLLDGALSAGLYRRLRRVEANSFLGTAFRKTFGPFLLVSLLMGAAGWGLQSYAPQARTLRGAWVHWQEARP